MNSGQFKVKISAAMLLFAILFLISNFPATAIGPTYYTGGAAVIKTWEFEETSDRLLVQVYRQQNFEEPEKFGDPIEVTGPDWEFRVEDMDYYVDLTAPNLVPWKYSFREIECAEPWQIRSEPCNIFDSYFDSQASIDGKGTIVCFVTNMGMPWADIRLIKYSYNHNQRWDTFSFELTGPIDHPTAPSHTIQVQPWNLVYSNPIHEREGFSLFYAYLNQTRERMVPGKYRLSEIGIPAGWELADLQCFGADSVIDFENQSVEIELKNGQIGTCTFENRESNNGRIKLKKYAYSDTHYLNPFYLEVFKENEDTLFLGISLKGNGGPYIMDLAPGIYSIIEYLPTYPDMRDWTAISTCGSSLGKEQTLAEIDLETDEIVECTIKNMPPNSIVIEKETFPAGSNQKFTFKNGDTVVAALADGEYEIIPITPEMIGTTIEIKELIPSNWELTDIVCQEGVFEPTLMRTKQAPEALPSYGDLNNGQAVIGIDAGESIFCKFTNRNKPPEEPELPETGFPSGD